MNVNDFKARVAGYMSREVTTFTIGGVDNVLEAINDSRRWAQQHYNFSMLSRRTFLTVPVTGANWQTGCTTSPGGDAVRMRTIEKLWLYSTPALSPTYKIDFAGPNELGRRLDYAPERNESYENSQYSRGLFAYTEGLLLRMSGVTADTNLMIWGTEDLPDLTDSSTSDFFIDNFSNWLLLATIQNLNGFLKEDQRVAISNAAVQSHWAGVTERDARAGVQGSWTNLD